MVFVRITALCHRVLRSMHDAVDGRTPSTHPALRHYVALLHLHLVSPSRLLQACAHLLSLRDRECIHAEAAKNGLVELVYVKNSLIHLYGACGLFESAHRVFDEILVLERNLVSWNSVLNGFAMHKKLELGEAAWERLVELDPGHSGDYVLLSNLYAAVGRWADVHVLRKTMINDGVRKNPGQSLVELRNSVYEFVMGDRSHPESEQIYQMLAKMADRLIREGYIPHTNNVLADIEEEER